MPMQKKTKLMLTSATTKVIALAILMVFCIGSAFSVMAAVVDITVVDGAQSISFEITGTNPDKIMERAQNYGIEPLGAYDTSIFDAKTNTVTIYRSVTATVLDAEQKHVVEVGSFELDANKIITAAIKQCDIAPITENDQILYDAKTNKVEIIRSVQVFLKTENSTKSLKAYNNQNVSQLLAQQAISLDELDVVSQELDASLHQGMKIEIFRNRTITVTADGTTETYIVPSGTLASALDKIGISVGEDDIVSADLKDTVTEGMSVVIQRVVYEEVEKEVPIAYETIWKDTSSLYKGNTQIETYGQDGIRKVVVREKRVDGEVIEDEEEELSSEIIQEPVSEVILVGTKVSLTYGGVSATVGDGTIIDHNGNTISFSSVYKGKCSAYTGGGTTSTGLPAQFGYVAVNPNVIPYGTRMYICSPDGRFVYGYAIAADTGGAVMGGNYLADLYYDTYAECSVFGIRTMCAYILS